MSGIKMLNGGEEIPHTNDPQCPLCYKLPKLAFTKKGVIYFCPYCRITFKK